MISRIPILSKLFVLWTICPKHRILASDTAPSLSGSGSNGNEGVHDTFKSLKTRASLQDTI